MTDRLYEFGRAMGEGRSLEYLSQDWRETKTDFRDTSDTFCKGAKWIIENFGQILSKSSYPITGSLSLTVRERLEDYFGKNVFNQREAGITSCISDSLLLMGGLGYFICSNMEDSVKTNPLSYIMPFYACLSLGAYYTLARIEGTGHMINPRASPLGKIVSLPIEAGIGIYDGIRARKKSKK